jgi:hypothetical protein
MTEGYMKGEDTPCVVCKETIPAFASRRIQKNATTDVWENICLRCWKQMGTPLEITPQQSGALKVGQVISDPGGPLDGHVITRVEVGDLAIAAVSTKPTIDEANDNFEAPAVGADKVSVKAWSPNTERTALPECPDCGTQWSPIWFHAEIGDTVTLCHRCVLKRELKKSMEKFKNEGSAFVGIKPLDKPERDPYGRDPHTGGAKLDAGKIKPRLVLGSFARALREVSKVGTIGAAKYTDDGWVKVPDGFDRYTDAMLRHWLDEQSGEEKDKDTGLLHMAHMAWNVLARLELYLREGEEP